MKRTIDVVASGMGLILLSPVLVVLGLVIRVTDRGPALFRQIRVGRGNTRFEILKFRTMRVHRDGPPITGHADPRITRVGRLLRNSKLDELPQLINVLRGDMSLVGPRPEVPELAQYWTEDQASTILSVRPGITDPASIRFRDENLELAGQKDPQAHYINTILPAKAAMYVEYVQGRTLLGDIRLILETIAPRSR